MKKSNNYSNQLFAVCSAILLMFCCGGCVKNTVSPSSPEEARLFEEPKRLIVDYSNMKEDDTVAWYWVKPGFQIGSYRSAKLYPLKNYTQFEHVGTEERIQGVLQEIFSQSKNVSQSGTDIGIIAAIVDMKHKRGLIERLNSSIDVNPFIEIEIIIIEESSQKVLFKLTHFKKAEDLKDALNGITNDLIKFFQNRIPYLKETQTSQKE